MGQRTGQRCSAEAEGVTERQARDEGAGQTRLIVDEIRKLRTARGWSAQQLADAMTDAGVPWNADVVVNLEHGRRKSLRVHELLALLAVLDAEKPLEALVPGGEAFPVLPGLLAPPGDVRAWLRGESASPLARDDGATASDLIAQRIRELRNARGMTVADLAARCEAAGMPKLTAQALYKLEGQRNALDRPPRPVTVDELLVLARALGVTPAELCPRITTGRH
jgi:transcriptional regulator with XRE-family HTH domain